MPALAAAVGLVAVVMAFLHPGYAINDDLKIVAIAAGYPGVTPSPFLVFSNVLLGLALVPLYALRTPLNWEMVLFVLSNVASLATLIHILLTTASSRLVRAAGSALLLACGVYFAQNLTFSSTAAFAALAGLSAIVMGSLRMRGSGVLLIGAGVVLVVWASLVRVQMIVLVMPLVVVSGVFILRALEPRTLAASLGIAALLVAAGLAFDRLYVHADPNWNTYYYYNSVAQKLQDSHRLENMKLEIRRVSWSDNDQELFARYFFPDAGVYSIDRIHYLVAHVAGIGTNALYSAQSFLSRVSSLGAAPYVFICLGVLLWALIGKYPTSVRIATALTAGTALAENAALVWIYKNPDYVMLSLLASAAVLCILLVATAASTDRFTVGAPAPAKAGALASGAVLLAALIAIGVQTVLVSRVHARKQRIYGQVLRDLDSLQASSRLPADAVIISPAHGLPWDWSNPLVLDLPQVPYVDTGWNTFSPYYDEALARYGSAPLLDALHTQSNAYLMTESIFQPFLKRYYQEHEGIQVTFRDVYSLPNPDNYEGYEGVVLYKVEKAP